MTPPPAAVDDHGERVHPGSQGSIWSSMYHAWHGVVHVVKHERNARVHLAFALLALGVGMLLRVTNAELAAIFFAVILVFLAEIVNTAIERTLDLIDIRENARIKIIKDMAAGAVLVSAVAAAAMGLVIFLPHVMRMLWAS